MGDRLGQQLGNYRLVKLLGKGGFAEVYLGQHVHLASKQAAIKILHLMDVDVRKFQEEAETTEKLVHPHIVRLLDFALEQDTPFLVLDFAPGGSLRTRHPKGSVVPLSTVEAYLKELAPALQYAHDLHILHRDIKPDNMLIGRQGELLLSDFGIAVLTQTGRTSMSVAYGIGGTPYYMAPETYRGRPEKASDQYALAVVVYEWLCGSVPFSEGGFIQIGYQHAHEPVPSLREKNPAIPPEVEAVIMKTLAKEPKDRFASVQTFVQAFEQACSQARQFEEERLRQAEEQERAHLAEEERLHQAEEERARLAEAERLRQTKKAEQARQGQQERVDNIVEQTSSLLGPSISSITSQPNHRRLPVVSVVLILLTLLLFGGGFGVYGAVTGKWSNQGAQIHTTATAQVHATATSDVGQFGAPVDATKSNSVVINIELPPSGATCSPACFSPMNMKVKVGTTITWINKSTTPHTVTAIKGVSPASETPAPQIFDSGVSTLLAPGHSFTYKVTQAAYNFNKDHVVLYYCQIHPSMVAVLTIVP